MLVNSSVDGEAGDMALWLPRLNTNAVISTVREVREREEVCMKGRCVCSILG